MRTIYGRRVNAIDDPLCEANHDWGPAGSGDQPPIVEGTAGVAAPRTSTIAIAVRAPKTVFVWCTNSNGRVLSRVRINAGDLHIMHSPFGSSAQFSLAPELCDPADSEAMGAFRTAPEYASLAIDPRVVLLRHFWAQKFYWDQSEPYVVEPFAVARTGPVRVVGAIALVSIGRRWFSGDQSVHADLGRCTIVEQGPGMRFLKPDELYYEFESLGTDDHRVPYKLA